MERNKFGFVYLFMMVALLSFFTSSCSKSTANDEGNGFGDDSENSTALSSLKGHEIRFYYESGGKLYRAMNIAENKDGEPIVLNYSAQAMIYDGTELDYKKTSGNSASVDLTVYFYPHTLNPDDWADTWHQYNMKLTFSSNKEGRAEVIALNKQMVMGKVYTVKSTKTWYFKVDSEEEPNFTEIENKLGQENNQSGNSSREAWMKGYKDVAETSVVIEGTVRGEGLAEWGVCYAEHINPTVDDKVVKCKYNVIETTIGNLKEATIYYVRIYALYNDGEMIYSKPVSFETTKTGRYEIQYGNDVSIKINEIVHWYGREMVYAMALRASSNTNKYDAVRFCYAKHENPTQNDYTVSAYMTDENNMNTTLEEGIKNNTKYYIRPYTIKGNILTYYEEESFTTMGDEFDIQLKKDTDGKSCIVSYKTPEIGNYKLYYYLYSYKGIYPSQDQGLINGEGVARISISDYQYSNYGQCYVYIKDMTTGIDYTNVYNLGGK